MEQLHKQIKDLRERLHEVAFESENAQEAALCDTAGEVVGGLDEAFEHFLHE